MPNTAQNPEEDSHITAGVLDEFAHICAMPHGSGNEWQASNYMMLRLSEMGLYPRRDEAGNVVCDVPASPGCENAPMVVLQGHMDMVCVAAEGSGYNPLRDGITTVIKDGRLRSDGRSSLGADCGIGNAAALYTVAEGTEHGPLRLIFTTGEETGLTGALQLPAEVVKDVKYLINLDGFRFGDVVISSSGGRRELFTRRLHTATPKRARAFHIRLSGFLGGHSGYDINKNRGNAVKLMAHFIHEMAMNLPLEIASFEGGVTHNAIPTDCHVVLLTDDAYTDTLMRGCELFREKLGSMFVLTDDSWSFDIRECARPRQVWSADCVSAAVNLVLLLQNGVYSMNNYVPDRVASSSNLGRIQVNGKGFIELAVMVRCAVDANEEVIAGQHQTAAQLTGFNHSESGYGGWPGTTENPLAQLMCRVCEERLGLSLNVTATHAGLETSAFYALDPELVMVNIGMDVVNPHSLDENVDISTIAPFVRVLRETLREIGTSDEA